MLRTEHQIQRLLPGEVGALVTRDLAQGLPLPRVSQLCALGQGTTKTIQTTQFLTHHRCTTAQHRRGVETARCRQVRTGTEQR
ncbi:hypothetical protein D3C72_2062670 [compost metagenome]